MMFPPTTLKHKLNKDYFLLLNTLTGAIDVVPTKIINSPSASEIKYLDKRGYFIKGSPETEKKILALNEKQGQNIPYWFYILTTLNCNFNCPICYEKKTLVNSEIDSKTLPKIINFIDGFQKKNHLKNDRINLIVFGGEPLCVSDKNIIEYLLKTVAARGWKITFVTNGSQIKKFINLFKKYQNIKIDFRVTLDGTREIHNARRPYRDNRRSFKDVVEAIEMLLKNKLSVKMQTILGQGNFSNLDKLVTFVEGKKWLKNPYFQWRIEGSHDYANLDSQKDELSEGKMAKKIVDLCEKNSALGKKIKFESFKYLGHLVSAFGWLGKYKTYSGPKIGFCDPQKGFHYVFSTTGQIYHCPRTINNENFYVGSASQGLNVKSKKIKNKSIFQDKKCRPCPINTLCGGGCIVQKKNLKNFDCQKYALKILAEFIGLMKNKIMEKAVRGKIVSINSLWK